MTDSMPLDYSMPLDPEREPYPKHADVALPHELALPHEPTPTPYAGTAPCDGYASGRPNPAERTRLVATLGHLLRSARTSAGLTQRELGRRAGLGRRSVYELEAGRFRPSTLTLYALAAALTDGAEDAARHLYDALRVAAGPSLRIPPPGTRRRIPGPASAPALPATVPGHLLVEILERAAANLGIDATDERVRTAVVAAIREVTGGRPNRALDAAGPVRNP